MPISSASSKAFRCVGPVSSIAWGDFSPDLLGSRSVSRYLIRLIDNNVSWMTALLNAFACSID